MYGVRVCVCLFDEYMHTGVGGLARVQMRQRVCAFAFMCANKNVYACTAYVCVCACSRACLYAANGHMCLFEFICIPVLVVSREFNCVSACAFVFMC